jgi:hypothetical protein
VRRPGNDGVAIRRDGIVLKAGSRVRSSEGTRMTDTGFDAIVVKGLRA